MSTPVLDNFFTRKEGAFNFTAAPGAGHGINQRLQSIANSKDPVRFKPNQAEPMDENSRRAVFQTPKRDVQFGLNPFSQRPTTDSPSMLGFSPITTNNQPPSSDIPEFQQILIKAIKDKAVVTPWSVHKTPAVQLP